MAWDSYYHEICKAKDDYDKEVKPLLEMLKAVHDRAWNNYIMRIANAEILLKEDQS